MLEKSTQMCRAPNTGSEPTAGKCAARAKRDRLSPRRGRAEDTFCAIVLYARFLSFFLSWEREGGGWGPLYISLPFVLGGSWLESWPKASCWKGERCMGNGEWMVVYAGGDGVLGGDGCGFFDIG